MVRWKTNDVAEWLEECLQLPYGHVFRQAGIDGNTLVDLDNEALAKLGIVENAHVLRLLSHISVFRSQLGRPLLVQEPQPKPAKAPKGNAGVVTRSSSSSPKRSERRRSKEGKETGLQASLESQGSLVPDPAVSDAWIQIGESPTQKAPVQVPKLSLQKLRRPDQLPEKSKSLSQKSQGSLRSQVQKASGQQKGPSPGQMERKGKGQERAETAAPKSEAAEVHTAKATQHKPKVFTPLRLSPSRTSTTEPVQAKVSSRPAAPNQRRPAAAQTLEASRQPLQGLRAPVRSRSVPSSGSRRVRRDPSAERSQPEERKRQGSAKPKRVNEPSAPEDADAESDSLVHPLFAGSYMLDVAASPAFGEQRQTGHTAWENPQLNFPSPNSPGELAQAYFPPSPTGSRPVPAPENCHFGFNLTSDVLSDADADTDGSFFCAEDWCQMQLSSWQPNDITDGIDITDGNESFRFLQGEDSIREDSIALDEPKELQKLEMAMRDEEFSFLGVSKSCGTATTASSSGAAIRTDGASPVGNGSSLGEGKADERNAIAHSANVVITPRSARSCGTPRSQISRTSKEVYSEFGHDYRPSAPFTLSSQRSLPAQESSGPGPACYQLTRSSLDKKGCSKFSSAPRAMMTGRENPARTRSPGAKYHTDTRERVKGGTWDSTQRFKAETQDIKNRSERSPGPVAYTPRRQYLSNFR